MVLSNAERQKRYRQRLKQAASHGVTPEMVARIGRLTYGLAFGDDPPWHEWRKSRASKSYWTGILPDNPDDDFSDYGDDAQAAKLVAAVVRAVKFPPAE